MVKNYIIKCMNVSRANVETFMHIQFHIGMRPDGVLLVRKWELFVQVLAFW